MPLFENLNSKFPKRVAGSKTAGFLVALAIGAGAGIVACEAGNDSCEPFDVYAKADLGRSGLNQSTVVWIEPVKSSEVADEINPYGKVEVKGWVYLENPHSDQERKLKLFLLEDDSGYVAVRDVQSVPYGAITQEQQTAPTTAECFVSPV